MRRALPDAASSSAASTAGIRAARAARSSFRPRRRSAPSARSPSWWAATGARQPAPIGRDAGALGLDPPPCLGRVAVRDERLLARAHLQRERALGRLRQHRLDRKPERRSRSARPSRSRPHAARTSASRPRSCALRSRVSMLPRSGSTEMRRVEGEQLRAATHRGGADPHPRLERIGADERVARIVALQVGAHDEAVACRVEVMSFAECTATSIRSASSASSISLTNTPRSPICPNGLERSRSPAVVIGTNAISWPAARTTSAASSACVSASREPREPMRTSTAGLPPASRLAPRRARTGGGAPRRRPRRRPPAAACFIRTVGSWRSLFRSCAVTALEALALLLGKRRELRKLGGPDRLGARREATRSPARHRARRATHGSARPPRSRAARRPRPPPVARRASRSRPPRDRRCRRGSSRRAGARAGSTSRGTAMSMKKSGRRRRAGTSAASITRPGAAVEVSTTSTSPSFAGISSRRERRAAEARGELAAPSGLRLAT